jgi:hypothetical protein
MTPPQPAEPVVTPTQYTSVETFLKENPIAKRTTVYKGIRDGRIPHVRIGRRILVPRNALDLMREAQREQVADAGAE